MFFEGEIGGKVSEGSKKQARNYLSRQSRQFKLIHNVPNHTA